MWRKAVGRREFVRGGAVAGIAIGVAGGAGPVAWAETPVASPEASPAVGTRSIEHARGTSVIPADPQRVIALGDEFVLADLLDLGIVPVASTATYGDRFIGIPEERTEGIVPLWLWELDVEAMVALAPDLIVAPDYVFQAQPDGYETLSQLAPVVAIPDDPDWVVDFQFIAAIFGKESLADELLAGLDAEIADAAEVLGVAGQTVSVVTVYPGDTSVTAWMLPQLMQVDILMQLGLEIRPDAETLEHDAAGRAAISLEEVKVIDGETIVMLQTADAEDEVASLEEVTANPLWSTIPAVQADRVFITERVGYPGSISGRRAFLETCGEIFG
ncbi:MAG: ABC transporter substrate-binding protein [Thermomicrobiales bacterium]